MRKISASYVFPVNSKPLKQGILTVSDNGEILDVTDTKGNLKETANVEYYNGILVPGFVNSHCHLELSYLKGLIQKANGLQDFILQLSKKRAFPPDNLKEIIKDADEEMWNEGIVAVGDISNDNFSFSIKENSSIYYHTFVEVFWPEAEKAPEVFKKAGMLYNVLVKEGLAASIVSHAPYSMSPNLMQMVYEHSVKNNSIFSIHNQETLSENELYIKGTGAMRDLFTRMGIFMNDIKPTGKTSLQSVFQYIPKDQNVLLVHNIFTGEDDIKKAKQEIKNLFWVICPKSNLIIENKLPDIELFRKNKLTLTVGTDSYSSNTKLSIIDEIKTLSEHFRSVPLEELLAWATLNGAKALNIDNKIGSFEKGKKPGVNLITDIDFEGMKLTEKSRVKKLV
jgi:cytosine/adenosine deaminase-related metal-dependent hydrolase